MRNVEAGEPKPRPRPRKATEVKVAKADKAIAAKIDNAMASIANARVKAMTEIETVAAEAAEAMVGSGLRPVGR